MKAALFALVMLAAPVVALAHGSGEGNAYAYGHEKHDHDGTAYAYGHEKHDHDGTAYAYGHEKHDHDGTVSAPEIDPTAITGPLVLLTTGTVILTDRFRRKRPC